MKLTTIQPAPLTVLPGNSALVLDSPHSGTQYPKDFGHAVSLTALRVAEDTGVEALWGFAPDIGATLVHAGFPRSYIDANRALVDIDPLLLDAPWTGPLHDGPKVRLGKGLVWRLLDDGTPIYQRRLSPDEVTRRIDACWRPYHDALEAAIDATVARHGHVIHLNCHSMPAVSAAYSTDHPGLRHADFVLGDRDGTTADPRLTRFVERFLLGHGYTVSVNHPYKGVEIVRKHGRPAEQRHSLQVEVNKRLYMDEQTFARHDGFAVVQAALRGLAEALTGLDPHRLQDLV
jgi:N-formylglutamate deformylase